MKRIKNSQGFTVVEVLLTLIVLILLGFGTYYVISQNSEDSSDSTYVANKSQTENTTPSNSEPQTTTTEETQTVPDGWTTYEDSEHNVSFIYPSKWVKDSCDETGHSYVFMMDGSKMKCGTGGFSDNWVSFSYTYDTKQNCSEVSDNNVQTSACEVTTFGQNKVLVETYTQTKDEGLGTPIGTIRKIFNFIEPNYNNMYVSYYMAPTSADISGDIETLLSSVSQLQ